MPEWQAIKVRLDSMAELILCDGTPSVRCLSGHMALKHMVHVTDGI